MRERDIPFDEYVELQRQRLQDHLFGHRMPEAVDEEHYVQGAENDHQSFYDPMSGMK